MGESRKRQSCDFIQDTKHKCRAPRRYALTHLLTYSHTLSLTYSLTHSPTHLLTHSLTHSLTYSLTHSDEQPQSNPVYNFKLPANEDLQNVAAMTFKEKQIWSLTHSPSHSLTHLLTHSPTHSLTYSLTHSLTHSLGLSSRWQRCRGRGRWVACVWM